MTRSPGGPALVIPVKATAGAKQRLSGRLDAEGRRMLALAMAGDVLGAATRGVPPARIVVISGDDAVEELATRHGVEAVRERGAGQSAAVRTGVAWAVERGHSSVATIAADCPLASTEDIDALMACASRRGRLFAAVQDAGGTGTNAAALRPLDVDPWRFGAASWHRHREAAAELRLRFVPLDLEGFRVDCDRPDDLDRVLEVPRPTATYHVLRELLIATGTAVT